MINYLECILNFSRPNCIIIFFTCNRTHTSDNRQCTPEEFECNNGDCIPKTKTCNLFPDCLKGEDEVLCGKLSIPIHKTIKLYVLHEAFVVYLW